jgi:uncharacterized protein YkwD
MRLPFIFFSVALAVSPAYVASQEAEIAKLTEAEKQILDLTNAIRKEHRLPALKVNATLVKCARAHSDNMAKQSTLAHSLDDKSPFDRLRAAGYTYRAAGENIATGRSAKGAFDGWMESEGHRKNILSSEFSEIGLGAATTGDPKYYTQVFGQPLR